MYFYKTSKYRLWRFDQELRCLMIHCSTLWCSLSSRWCAGSIICTKNGSYILYTFCLLYESISSRHCSHISATRNVRALNIMCLFLLHNNFRKVISLLFPIPKSLFCTRPEETATKGRSSWRSALGWWI